MSEDYRVPVERLKVQVWLVGGQERDLELYCPLHVPVESMLDDDRRFLPAADGEGVCLVARHAVVAMRVEGAPEGDGGLFTVTRKVAVTLGTGRDVRGDLRFVASSGQGRTADFLNGPSSYFSLYRPEDVVHVVKRHVQLVVEEV